MATAPKEDLSAPVKKEADAPASRDVPTLYDVPPIPATNPGCYEVVAWSAYHLYDMLGAYPNVTTYSYDECNVIAPPAVIVLP